MLYLDFYYAVYFTSKWVFLKLGYLFDYIRSVKIIN